MNLEAYITRFRLLQRAVEKDERMLSLMGRSEYTAFLRRFGGAESTVLSPHLLTREGVAARIRRRQRLCLRYAERITRAAERLPSPVLQQYALCRYLYGMTHEDIADESYFSVRTVYRQARMARKEMAAALLRVMPRPCRGDKGKRYHPAGRLPRRSYAVTKAEKGAARCRGLGSPALTRELRFTS